MSANRKTHRKHGEAWTPERIEAAKQMRLSGLSSAQIAERLGGVTRNSVIAKLARCGMSEIRVPFWNEGRDADLTRLWKANVPSKEAADILGARDAREVNRRAQHLGLPSRRKQAEEASAVIMSLYAREPKAPAVKRDPHAGAGLNNKNWASQNAGAATNRADSYSPTRQAPLHLAAKANAWAPLPGSTPVRLIDRAPFQCRWPLDLQSETDHHMCGLYAAGDRYCEAHEARSRAAVQPAKLKPRDLEVRRRAA